VDRRYRLSTRPSARFFHSFRPSVDAARPACLTGKKFSWQASNNSRGRSPTCIRASTSPSSRSAPHVRVRRAGLPGERRLHGPGQLGHGSGRRRALRYRLLWVLVMSNAMAILLQTLSARLGIVHGRDLAQACRETYPRSLSFALWVLSEIAIAACDLLKCWAPRLPQPAVPHPAADRRDSHRRRHAAAALVPKLRHRTIEAFILSLSCDAVCFCIEVLWAHPAAGELFNGLVPRLNAAASTWRSPSWVPP